MASAAINIHEPLLPGSSMGETKAMFPLLLVNLEAKILQERAFSHQLFGCCTSSIKSHGLGVLFFKALVCCPEETLKKRGFDCLFHIPP